MKTLSNPLGTQSYRQGFGHGQRYPNTPAFGSLRGQRHLGTDWLLPTGGTLYAPEDGVISRLYTGQGGNTIVLEGRRYIHRFMHLSEYRVEVNQKVKKGQVIGITGNTGLSTAPHLHWDVWDKYNGAFNHLEFAGFVDPLSFPMIKELPKPPKPMTELESVQQVSNVHFSLFGAPPSRSSAGHDAKLLREGKRSVSQLRRMYRTEVEQARQQGFVTSDRGNSSLEHKSYAQNYPDICREYGIRRDKNDMINAGDANRKRKELYNHYMEHGIRENRTDSPLR